MSPRANLAAALATALVVVGAAAEQAGAQALAPITLTDAGADAKRRPFARWAPAYPIVNIAVSTRPIGDATGQPALRYRVQSGTYGALDDGPTPFWRGDDALVPGVYYTAIDGDAPSQGALPWTPFKRFRVTARRGEWTGATSQKRYVRFTRPRRGRIRGLAFSVYARGSGCEAHSTFALPRDLRVRRDGRFSARFRGVRNLPGTSTATIRVAGRIRRGFARGTIFVDDLFEGCRSGRIRWSARP